MRVYLGISLLHFHLDKQYTGPLLGPRESVNGDGTNNSWRRGSWHLTSQVFHAPYTPLDGVMLLPRPFALIGPG